MTVYGITAALLLSVHGPQGIGNAWRAALGGASEADELRAVGFWLHATAILVATGLLGSLVGFVLILGALDSPSTVGARVAIALISLLYGLAGAVASGAVAMRLAWVRGTPNQIAGVGAGVLFALMVGCGIGALVAPASMLAVVILCFLQ